MYKLVKIYRIMQKIVSKEVTE